MDSNVLAGLLGAIATLIAVIVGALLGSAADRRREGKERFELTAALLAELNLITFDALNCAELVRRLVDEKCVPTSGGFKRYLPHTPHLYRSLGHKIVILKPESAGAIVEFYGELEKVISRMDRILGGNSRVTKKSKLESLAGAADDWSYVLSSGARAIDALVKGSGRRLSGGLREDVTFRLDALWNFGKNGRQWYLPDDEISMMLVDPELEAPH